MGFKAMKYKTILTIGIVFSINGCAKAQKINPDIYKCSSNDSNYIERCKLKDAKEMYYTNEVNYFRSQMGGKVLTSEIPEYAEKFIKNAETYCTMNVGLSYVDAPKSNIEIHENIVKCLVPQYKQLGENLRNMTDSGTKAVIERIKRSVEG